MARGEVLDERAERDTQEGEFGKLREVMNEVETKKEVDKTLKDATPTDMKTAMDEKVGYSFCHPVVLSTRRGHVRTSLQLNVIVLAPPA